MAYRTPEDVVSNKREDKRRKKEIEKFYSTRDSRQSIVEMKQPEEPPQNRLTKPKFKPYPVDKAAPTHNIPVDNLQQYNWLDVHSFKKEGPHAVEAQRKSDFNGGVETDPRYYY